MKIKLAKKLTTTEVDQNTLAKLCGISAPSLSMILSGRRIATKRQAAKLEEWTGIDLRAWLFPNEHKNPLIKGK